MNLLPFHERKALLKWVEERFGIPAFFFEDKILFARGRDIWMTTQEATEMPLVQVTRKGMRLARRDRNDYRLATPAIQYLGSFATRRVLDISPKEAERYIRGEDLLLPHLPPLPRGQVILRTQGRPLGSGLLREKGIKNQIPVAHRVRKALEVDEER